MHSAVSAQWAQTGPRCPAAPAGGAPVVSRGRAGPLAHREHPVSPYATGGMPAPTIHPLVFILVLAVL